MSASPGHSALNIYCVPFWQPSCSERSELRLPIRPSGASASVHDGAEKVFDTVGGLAFFDMAIPLEGDPADMASASHVGNAFIFVLLNSLAGMPFVDGMPPFVGAPPRFFPTRFDSLSGGQLKQTSPESRSSSLEVLLSRSHRSTLG